MKESMEKEYFIQGWDISNKEIPSECDYCYQYQKISKQIDCLLELFPEIGNNTEIINNQNLYLPLEAEEWFVIPKWQNLAPTYLEAVKKVIDKIKKIQGDSFKNYLEKDLENSSFFHQSPESLESLQALNQSNCDFLIIAAQFGRRHRGRSPGKVLEIINIYNNNSKFKEIPLGLYSVGIMLLTHFDRLKFRDDLLWIDCIGDWIINENHLLYPCIINNGGKIRINARTNHFSYDYGAVTGFIIA